MGIIFINLINHPAILGSGVNSAPKRPEFQTYKQNMFLRSREQSVREADKVTAIC
jgi:hypothetical protein